MAYTPPTQVIGTGFKVSTIFATTSDITLYVRTTGDDSNTGLATGTALLTVQEAINRIPSSIGHTVVIDIGEGTFGGFTLPTKSYTASTASLTIKGVTATATGLASGTASGTATGGTTLTLVDSGQSWTANDLRGRMALVDGEYRVIYSNDATSLVFVGPFTLTTSGKAYEVVEQKTILNTLGSSDTVVLISGQVATKSYTAGVNPPWAIQDIKITTPSTTTYSGVQCTGGNGGIIARVAITSQAGQQGLRLYDLWGNYSIYDVYITAGAYGLYQRGGAQAINAAPINRIFCYNCTTVGIYATNSPFPNTYDAYINSCPIGIQSIYCSLSQHLNCHVESCSTTGILSQNDGRLNVNGSRLLISACGIGVTAQATRSVRLTGTTIIQSSTSHGVQIGDGVGDWPTAYNLYVDSSKIINNGGSGIYARGACQVYINSLGTSGGTGNTRFGIELEDGAQALVRSGIIANPLTGAMGDAAIDDFKTVLTWSTDFAANLASVTDDTVGTSIKRRD